MLLFMKDMWTQQLILNSPGLVNLCDHVLPLPVIDLLPLKFSGLGFLTAQGHNGTAQGRNVQRRARFQAG